MNGKIKKSLFLLGFTLLGFLSLVPEKDSFGEVDIPKKYLLNGSLLSNDSSFSYYLLSGSTNEVAIGKGDNYATYNTLTIPEKVTLDGTEYSVTGIWHRGFAHCSISSLSLPNTISVIDYEAFYGNNIVSLNIPYSVEKRGSGAFALNKNLKTLTFNESENSVPSGDREACPVGENSEEETEPLSQESSSMSAKLTEIPDYCFDRCESLTYLTFPSSLKSIRYGAFQRCTGLTSLYLPSGLTLVEGKAFNFCQSLTRVYIPSSLTSLNTDNTLKGRIDPFAFTFCNGNRVLQFAADQSSIQTWENINGNEWEFKTDRKEDDDRYSKKTRQYDLGDLKVSGVWQYKDYTCYGEQGIQLVRYLGDRVKLQGRVQDRDGNLYQRYAVGMPSSIGGRKVISLDRGCLDNLQSKSNNLTDLFLPDTLLEIQSQFLAISNQKIKFPQLFIIDVAKNNCFNPDYSMDYSKDRKPKGYVRLEGIENLHSIGDFAFCTSSDVNLNKLATEITLPGRLESIGQYSFEGRDYATKFSLTNDPSYDKGLKILKGAFGWLGFKSSGVKEVTLPSRTTAVGDLAFQSSKISTLSFWNAEKDKEFYGTMPKTRYSLSLGSSIINNSSNNTTPFIYVYDRGSTSVETGTSYFQVTRRQSTFCTANAINEYGYSNQGCLEVFLPSSVIVTDNNGYTTNNCYTTPLFPKSGRITLYFSEAIKKDFNRDFDLISKDVSGTSQGPYNFGSNEDSLRTYYYRRLPYYENVDIRQRDSNTLTVSAGKKILKHKDGISYLLDPSTDTAKVTRYLDYGFSGAKKIEIPETLTYGQEIFTVDEIGDNAFACSDLSKDRTLSSLVLPDKIKKIGKYSFFKCAGLTEISVKKNSTTESFTRPSSLNYIGSFAFAFSGVTKLLQINDDCEIADSGDCSIPSPFYNCPNLSSISLKVSGNTPRLKLTTDQRSLLADDTVVWVTSSVPGTSTKSFSFQNKFHYGVLRCANWITGLTLNPSYLPLDKNGNVIPQALFNGFSIDSIRRSFRFGSSYNGNSGAALSSLVIEKDDHGGLSVPNGAFKNCDSLNEITIPNVKGATKNTILPASLFADAKNVKYFKVEGDVNTGKEGILDLRNTGYTAIEDNAFTGRTSIKEILLPDTRKSIGSNAFSDCTGLTSLTCGAGLEAMGSNAFQNCTSLKSFVADKALKTIASDAFNGCTGMKKLTLNKGLTSIGVSAFEKCIAISSVTIPNTVETIGRRAFCSGNANTGSLKQVIFEDGCKLTEIPEKFVQYQPLETLTLPATITSIGKQAFSYTNIKELDISLLSGMVSFQGFDNCVNLSKVTLPTSIKTLSGSSLSGCTSLTEINIDQLTALETIEGNAFKGAFASSGNLSLKIPSSLKALGSNAFESTGAGLKTIIFTGKKFDRKANTFTGSKIDNIIFQDAGTGSGFSNTTYESGCFGNMPNLKTVVLPSTFDVKNNNTIFNGSNSNVRVCLHRKKSSSTTFGKWVNIDGTHQVTYAFEDEDQKQAGTYYWKWNEDKTDVTIELYSSTSTASLHKRNELLIFSFEKLLRLFSPR